MVGTFKSSILEHFETSGLSSVASAMLMAAFNDPFNELPKTWSKTLHYRLIGTWISAKWSK